MNDTNTYEEIAEIRRKSGVNRNDLISGPLGFMGMNIYEEPLPPQKMMLSKDIDVSPEFRREFNAWLLEYFGREKPLLEDGKCLISEKYGSAIMKPEHMAILKMETVA